MSYELEVDGEVIKTHCHYPTLREWATINVGVYWEIYHIWVQSKLNKSVIGKRWKFSNELMDRIEREWERGHNTAELADRYDCSTAHIENIVSGRIVSKGVLDYPAK